MTFDERYTLGEPCESALIEYVDGRAGWRAEPFGVGRFAPAFCAALRTMIGNPYADAVRLSADALIVHSRLNLLLYADVKTKQPQYSNFAVAVDGYRQAALITNADFVPPFVYVFADPACGPGLWRVCPAATLPHHILRYLPASSSRAGSGKACLLIDPSDLPSLSEFIADPLAHLPKPSASLSLALDALTGGVRA